MFSTRQTIAALLALGVLGTSSVLAQTATSEPSEKPMMQNRGGAMMQRQDMQRGWMHGDMRGMMGRGGRMGPDMMAMMMIMVDTNGDGALSLEEVQAVHARMFNYVDVDDDDRLTLEELRGFFHGGADPGRR